MDTYLLLLRGINVGGKNKVPMAALRGVLEDLGYERVQSYIASGNVIVDSPMPAAEVRAEVETLLPQAFELDSDLIKVLVLAPDRLADVVANRPAGFGEAPEKFHSDALFLIDVDADEVMPVFRPREGVDAVWPGKGVVYSQRLSAERTKSRLSLVMTSPHYKSMTIRSWTTTLKLLELLDARKP